MVLVRGDSGPAVLLLPGGAESVDGFFPGLVEGLVADPGCRVIEYDRPGTGTSAVERSLADAPGHLHALIEDLVFGPVVAPATGGRPRRSSGCPFRAPSTPSISPIPTRSSMRAATWSAEPPGDPRRFGQSGGWSRRCAIAAASSRFGTPTLCRMCET